MYRGAVAERLDQLSYVAEGYRFESRWGQPMTGKLYVNPAVKWEPFTGE